MLRLPPISTRTDTLFPSTTLFRALGPSDSSDSGSDLPGSAGGFDTDSQGTGERESVEPSLEDDTGHDIEADRVVDKDEAGLAHSRPDPARNGGKRSEKPTTELQLPMPTSLSVFCLTQKNRKRKRPHHKPQPPN